MHYCHATNQSCIWVVRFWSRYYHCLSDDADVVFMVRWEEEKRPEGVKWTSLEHKGPVFAEAYLRLPNDVRFYYDGRHVRLSDTAEEVAGFYARMLEHEYTTRDIFNKNFMKDWRHVTNCSFVVVVD